jgi:hypothetical protein
MTTLQLINTGTYANDGTGDDLLTAFNKVNANFTLLQTDSGVAGAANLGTGAGIWADKNLLNLEFKSLTSTGGSVGITSTATTVNLESTTKLVNDTSPIAGGNINLNSYNISNGDAQTTIYGYDPRVDSVLLELLMDTNNLTVDMGSFSAPTGYETNPVTQRTSGGSGGYKWDFGANFTSINNKINFGNYTAGDPIQDAKDHQVTLTGNLSLAGSHNLTLTVTANTQLTLPTSGTLASTASNLGQFATTTSTGLFNVMADPTGSGGSLVFASSPTITSPTIAGHATIEGVTSTGATGTGNFVFSSSPTLYSASLTGTPVIGGTSVTGSTGTGNIVFATSPSFTTPNIDSATATSITAANSTFNFVTTATTINIGASTGTTTVNNNLTVTGNLTVNGTTTSVNTETGTAISASAGFVSTGTFTSSYTGGIIVDYVSGSSLGRISVGSGNGITFYNNANNTRVALLAIDQYGNTTPSGAILFSSATIAAAGSNQGTATAITADNTYISSGTGGVVLPTAVVGREISITNNTASAINVYPASGASIENSSVNIPTSLPAYATLGLAAKSTTNWWSIQPVYSSGTNISVTQSANGSVTWNTVASPTFTNITKTGLEITPANYITVNSSTTYALSTTVTDNILIIGASGLTATVTFPSSGLIDGQRLRIAVQGTYSVTLAVTAGPTLIGSAAGTVNQSTSIIYIYRASNTSWYRIQ